MKRTIGVTNFNGKHVTANDANVYVKFDFGGLYEWYRKQDKTISLLDVMTSEEFKESLDSCLSFREQNLFASKINDNVCISHSTLNIYAEANQKSRNFHFIVGMMLRKLSYPHIGQRSGMFAFYYLFSIS
jgi:hypothetical protein